MDILLWVGGSLVLLAILASQFLVFPALWRGFRGEWLRVPRERRGRAMVGGALSGVHGLVIAVLVIAEPWGHYSLVYVLGADLGALVLLVLGSVGAHLIRRRRRAKRRRADSA